MSRRLAVAACLAQLAAGLCVCVHGRSRLSIKSGPAM